MEPCLSEASHDSKKTQSFFLPRVPGKITRFPRSCQHHPHCHGNQAAPPPPPIPIPATGSFLAEQGGCQSCKSNTPAPTGPPRGVGEGAGTAAFWTWGHCQGGPRLGKRRPWAGEPPSPGLVTTLSMISDGKGGQKMLDVAGVASLSPCTPQPPNVTLCPSPTHTQSTRTPPEHHHHHHPLHQKWGHRAGDHQHPEWQVSVGKGEGRALGANELC